MATDSWREEGKPREKVALKQGFHLMDWMNLMRSSRPAGIQQKISKEELAKHCTRFDCWTSYKGTVYNITNYLPYHPGGEEKLMLAAGKDCTALFDKYHKWVNIQSIMGNCIVGTMLEDEEGDEKQVG